MLSSRFNYNNHLRFIRLQPLIILIATISLIGRSEAKIRDSNCPRICKNQFGNAAEPVCGSDGIIYASMCEMLKKTCGRSVKLAADPTICMRSSGSKCAHRCNSETDLVCGTDSHTYLNWCLLEVERCRLGNVVRLAHFGACNNISAHRENCPVDCDRAPNDGPVCGSDGNVYKSTCLMKLYTCGQGVVKTNRKYCQTTRHCREACWKTAKRVCGSDGKIYANSCRMKSKNCGKHVFEVPMSYCVIEERNSNNVIAADEIAGSADETVSNSNKCPTSCSEADLNNGTLICGSDLQIYRSQCELNLLNCGLNSWEQATSVDFEKCRSKLNKCLKIQCPAVDAAESEQSPDLVVCGSDAITYPSECHLRVASCMRGIKFAHFGQCNRNLDDLCPNDCKDRSTGTICGSDGNVYRSVCQMKKETCGQNVVAVGSKHCRTTEACETECPATKNHVCGSDNQIYDNECQMRQQNCGRHVYVVPMKQCLSRLQYTNDCKRLCSEIYDPVCASDGRTYSNLCFMENVRCEQHDLSLKHYGKCNEPASEPVKNFLY